MKKRLRICNRTAAVASLLILASGIQLEINPAASPLWIWIHIFIGIIFFAIIIAHLYLHFRLSNWIDRLRRQKSAATRWLALLSLATALSAIAATCHWLTDFTHSPLGGLHGKIGFAMILLTTCHTVRRHRHLLPGKIRQQTTTKSF